MRMTLAVLTLLSLATLPALAQAPDAPAAVTVAVAQSPAPSPSNTEEPAPEADACPSTQELLGTPVAPIEVALPPCSSYQSEYCANPGAIAYCQWTPLEPNFCICQSNHTWFCG